jgi:cytochrome c biogenesis factor
LSYGNGYKFQLSNLISKLLLYYTYICIFLKLIMNILLVKPSKLYENDSLVFLYILASRPHSFLFLLLVIIFNIHKLNIKIVTAIIFIIFYNTPQINFFNYVLNFFKINSINTSLQNGLLNIHPILIYYVYSQLIYLWVLKYIYTNNIQLFFRSSSYVYTITIISLFGMYLGALWANQELNWGGYWSWDPVEIISVFVCLLLINFLHNKFSQVTQSNLFFFAATLWIIYIVIRLGVISTIHSFIRTNNVNLYIFLSIICIVMYFSLFFNYNIKYIIRFLKISTIHNNYKIQVFIICMYTYFYLLYLLCSYYPLMVFLKLSDFYMLYFIFVIIYWVPLYNHLNIKNYVGALILGLFIGAVAGVKILILIFLVIYILKFFKMYISLHLILFTVYLVYVLFMSNLTCYSTQLTQRANFYIFNLSTSSKQLGTTVLYEISFFLKKNLIITKLKNLNQHINGFCILTNSFLSTYLFTKNFSLRFLYHLEILQITLITIILLILNFFKIYYSIKDNKITY